MDMKDKTFLNLRNGYIFRSKQRGIELSVNFKTTEKMKVSFFKNYFETVPVGEMEIEQWLFDESESYKEEVAKIRACSDPELKSRLKSQLPAITPAGTFYERKLDAKKSDSFLLCLDLDGKHNPLVSNWEQVKIDMSGIAGHLYSGLSVGGNGVFSIFRIYHPGLYRLHYLSLADDVMLLGYKVDRHCCSVCNLRGISYDPNPVYTPDSGEYEKFIEPNYTKYSRSQSASTKDTYMQVERILLDLEKRSLSMAEDYHDWYRICCALTHEFGEEGRDFFHRISRQSVKYTQIDCDRQYNVCLRYRGQRLAPITIKTFFQMCVESGLIAAKNMFSLQGFFCYGYLKSNRKL